jgi:hypothetical protein
VIALARPRSNCTVNYRPVFSSERTQLLTPNPEKKPRPSGHETAFTMAFRVFPRDSPRKSKECTLNTTPLFSSQSSGTHHISSLTKVHCLRVTDSQNHPTTHKIKIRTVTHVKTSKLKKLARLSAESQRSDVCAQPV